MSEAGDFGLMQISYAACEYPKHQQCMMMCFPLEHVNKM